MEIRRERGGWIALQLEPHETHLLRASLEDLDAQLNARAEEAGGPIPEIVPGVPDPFADTGQLELPTDPVLARLLPNAYADDDSAAAEYRRFTEPDLVAGKRAAIADLLTSLGDGSAPVRLDAAGVHSWLRALNDLRLSLGVRLNVDGVAPDASEADVWEEYPVENPDGPAFALYEWLAVLQEHLIRWSR